MRVVYLRGYFDDAAMSVLAGEMGRGSNYYEIRTEVRCFWKYRNFDVIMECVVCLAMDLFGTWRY